MFKKKKGVIMTVCLIVGTGDRVTLPTADIIILYVLGICIHTSRGQPGFYMRIMRLCVCVCVFLNLIFFSVCFAIACDNNNILDGFSQRGKHQHRHRYNS